MAKRFDPKQPNEEYYLSFNFTDDLNDEDEEISSVDSVVVTDLSDDSDVTTTLTDPVEQLNDENKVYVWVKGGTSGKRYKITVQITGTEGSIFELEGILPVFDK